MRTALGLLLLASCSEPPPPPPYVPPDFGGVDWVDAPPDLAGKVALVRWWTQG